jgi:hypothetical protein
MNSEHQNLDELFPVSRDYINRRCGLHKASAQQQNPDNFEDEDLGIINSKGNFTRCSDIAHLTEEQYSDIIPKIIDEFTNAGFTDVFLFFNKIDKGDILRSYNKLKGESNDPTAITAQKTNHSNKFIRFFQQLNVYSVRNFNGDSLLTSWTKENLERAFRYLDKPNYTVNAQLSEIIKAVYRPSVTIYSPIMTMSIIKALGCKTVFDPCIGWGGRMVGTVCNSNKDAGNIYEYTGCEPCVSTFENLVKMKNTLVELDKNVEANHINIINKPVEEVIITDEFASKSFDCCLTSPPYFDMEIYSDEATQSISKFSTYQSWLNEFIEPIIKYVCSHVTKYSCWSVKNIKTSGKYNIFDDVKSLHEKYGWKYSGKNYSIKKNVIKRNPKNNELKNEFRFDGDITFVFEKKSNC